MKVDLFFDRSEDSEVPEFIDQVRRLKAQYGEVRFVFCHV